MSIGIKCDLCGIPMSATESLNAFRMWNGIRVVQIEDVGLQGVPYDENFFICDLCMERAYELLAKIKAVMRNDRFRGGRDCAALAATRGDVA